MATLFIFFQFVLTFQPFNAPQGNLIRHPRSTFYLEYILATLTILLITPVAAVVFLLFVAPVNLCDTLAVLADKPLLLVVASLREIALLPADSGCLVGFVGAVLKIH